MRLEEALVVEDEEAGAVEMAQEMLLLHEKIDALLPELRRKVILFTGSRPGEGTSTVVRAFGKTVAEKANKSVLILDANEDHAQAPAPAEQAAPASWPESAPKGGSELQLQCAIYATGSPNLSISPFHRGAGLAPTVFDGPAVGQLMAQLKTRFDLVLIDSSPAMRAGGLTISGKADGVVLVVEADRTRWPVALRAKEAIESSGGTVLGIVFNKRRYYIPERLYRML